jgi:hypothetical protein
MGYLALQQPILVFELFGFALHLRLETVVLEVLHLDGLPEFVDVQFHEALAIVLAPLNLVDLMDEFSLMGLALPLEFVVFVHLQLMVLLVQLRYLLQQSRQLLLVGLLLRL